MKEFFSYVSVAAVLSICLLGLAFFALFRKKDRKNMAVIGANYYDVPIWKGKAKEVVYGEHHHRADLDVIVYSQSIFVGFASQGFPFVNINADEIQRVHFQRNSISIQVKQNGESIYVTIRGASEGDLHQLGKKAEFIKSRAKKQGKSMAGLGK